MIPAEVENGIQFPCIFMYLFADCIFRTYDSSGDPCEKRHASAGKSGVLAYGEPVYVVLMIASALCNYLFALWIERFQDQKKWIVSCGGDPESRTSGDL